MAGTLLALAGEGDVSINEFGTRVVVHVGDDANGSNQSERLVLAGLHQVADAKGDVEGPPIWKKRIGWWRDYVRDARRATARDVRGLGRHPDSFVGLMIVMVFTAAGLSLVLFDHIVVFVG